MAAASQARRLRPDLEIIALERGNWTSYSACGIPYFVGGEVDTLEQLVARTPDTFREKYNIDVRLRHEATEIDLAGQRVLVRDLEAGMDVEFGFDQLMVGTGARPAFPQVPGVNQPWIRGVQTLDDADDLVQFARTISCKNVVVVGGGYIGLEMGEAFVNRGAHVTVIDGGPHVMHSFDADMAALITSAMEKFGIDVRSEVRVTGFDDGRVITSAGEFPADLVVLGTGVIPNSALASAAGIATGVRGAIKVDKRQLTSAEGVFSAGDCAESLHLVSGQMVHVALGTIANKQARVAGINIAGGQATFPGVLGTAVSKICSTEVARTGLTEREAAQCGFDAVATTITSSTRAGYYPGAAPITVKMITARSDHRILGAQIIGQEGAAKRIDIVATAITAKFTVDQLIDTDLSYAPPFSPVWDPVATAARVTLSEL
jgi:NADPH-dependent 2,4-dienoyl-CoA reductase/sulfur reductase-like enzyme